ncbi:hypothetical protein KSX_34980 [Ktedonospora formicarum]|uniref:Uncharacterized protein n=1 Tax=Ktedonospora formicarum TaxID=2778364 RepID=A0A8J3MUE8_9CHLR|nr:hypothetical protein KSX_34980 [Ktedonospora formicarum]
MVEVCGKGQDQGCGDRDIIFEIMSYKQGQQAIFQIRSSNAAALLERDEGDTHRGTSAFIEDIGLSIPHP